ncbi:tripartite tricarboxylate transporter TctA [Agaricicola taiwanensis]|uniref:Tripartite tricarboxylate transporter TctA n=1 Tax=Agaricicola taiwanensis TaxID=591372 RepID=A0A8J2YB28_9RHOB|nr:tripartite tricarboxylate transporter permease [Agaricicola taiwanensis]GGE31138.1 tripartite tricarboxylate transporter TctA [Agaricicola taiwanensis]
MSLDYLWQGFEIAFRFENLLYAVVGCFVGTLVGALPALGPVTAIALLLPIAYTSNVPVDSTLILLAAIYYGCDYGGRITSILVNVPGDTGAVVTAFDGYPMARKGRAKDALAISAITSFVGGILAVIGLTAFAPMLAKLAIRFGPAEYFVLILFAFSTLTSFAGEQPVKAILGCALGSLLATVGLDPTTGAYRFTFNEPQLYEGIDMVAFIIGLFAIAEILLVLASDEKRMQAPIAYEGRISISADEAKACVGPTLRGSFIGFIAGILPGAGSTIASMLSYSIEKQLGDRNGTFGHGDIRGVAGPEAANNGSAGGSFAPMLTLGVPGSATTAVMLGALLLYNVQPGPQIFITQPDLVGALIASMYVGNVILLIMNLPMIGLFVRMVSVPNWILMPTILALGFIGVYSVFLSVLSMMLMLAIGVVGFILRATGFGVAPIMLGFVLGKILETNLRNGLATSNGDVTYFFSSVTSQILWVLILAVLVLPPIFKWRRALKEATARTAAPQPEA